MGTWLDILTQYCVGWGGGGIETNSQPAFREWRWVVFDEGEVIGVDSVDGSGRNHFWLPLHKGERDDGTCHFNACIDGILGRRGGAEIL